MNAAFRRYEALERLESYVPVIVEHLALVNWFPEHQCCKHWQTELSAWKTALRRFHKSKMKKKGNYTEELILDALETAIDSDDKKDLLLIQIESHGVTLPNNIDWNTLRKVFKEFSDELIS